MRDESLSKFWSGHGPTGPTGSAGPVGMACSRKFPKHIAVFYCGYPVYCPLEGRREGEAGGIIMSLYMSSHPIITSAVLHIYVAQPNQKS